MNKLIAICYFVLSLYGCDVGGSTFVHRTQADGTDTLYSKVVAQPGVARFECLRSASGRCHYTLFPPECAPRAESLPGSGGQRGERCTSRPLQRFAIAKGEIRQVPSLHGFRLCVSTEDGTPGPDCDLPKPLAAR